MQAMILTAPGAVLPLANVPTPRAGLDQLRLQVEACGVCRTDLHLVDGDLPHPKLPLVPGHEGVGRIVERGTNARRLSLGQRVGVPWLGQTCGSCSFFTSVHENLCDALQFTGYTLDGGYAEECLADTRYVIPLCGRIPTR